MKHIAIWGYGQEGQAAHNNLSKAYPDAKFTLIDSSHKDCPQGYLKDCVTEDDLDEATLQSFDLIVRSPGVSLYKPEVQQAIRLGVPITSGTNLWFEQYPDAKTIVITGTKGKSTTSTLLYHLMKAQGLDVQIAGNIGVPLLEAQPGKDWTILELSSYQIADLNHAPTISVLLNLYPEHTDWHGGVEQYYKDKTRLLRLEPKMASFIGKNCANFLAPDITARATSHSLTQYPLSSMGPLKGDHNKENISAALCICDYLELDIASCMDALETYTPLPHRLQELGEKDGVLYVDDSISTVPEATIEAIKIYHGRPISLIMGGMKRGQEFSQLIKAIETYSVDQVYLLPETGIDLHKQIPSTLCQNIDEAVSSARTDTVSGGVILLSPAAPSYGQFKNYKERGEKFKALSGL